MDKSNNSSCATSEQINELLLDQNKLLVKDNVKLLKCSNN